MGRERVVERETGRRDESNTVRVKDVEMEGKGGSTDSQQRGVDNPLIIVVMYHGEGSEYTRNIDKTMCE